MQKCAHQVSSETQCLLEPVQSQMLSQLHDAEGSSQKSGDKPLEGDHWGQFGRGGTWLEVHNKGKGTTTTRAGEFG